MADITAQEVKRLRDATGAGMMDCKKALVESDGDYDKAVEALRKKGLAKAAERADRENREGAVALATGGDRAALVQLKSETDFTAKNNAFLALVQKLADAVLSDGEGAVAGLTAAIEDLKLVTKENIEVGTVVEARETASRLKITHALIDLTPVDDPDVDSLVSAYGEPFACASSLGMLRISQAVAPNAKVLLTGDGGDDVGGHRLRLGRQCRWRVEP